MSTEQVYYGSDLKLNIHIDPIGGAEANSCQFKVKLFTSDGVYIEYRKDQLLKVDNSNFIATIDAAKLGEGRLSGLLEVEVPDIDFRGGYRTEVTLIKTNIKIRKWDA